MKIPKTIVFLRADGSSKIGLGHVHRLIALSQILRDNFECRFIIHSPLPGIKELILKSCESIIELDSNLQSDELSRFVTGQEIVVLDGYNFDTPYQQNIKQMGSPLVCIDDLHQYHFVSDVIINPSGGVKDDLYSKERTTELFSGPAFCLLKEPFLKAAKSRNKRTTNSLFICMGGADPDNYTSSALKHCLDFPFTSYEVVIGEAYAHKNKLYNEVKDLDGRIHLLSNLEPMALAGIMKECAVAVCSASGIAYEYLSVSGELYIKQTATNQIDLYHYLLDDKLAFRFEDFRLSEDEVTQSVQKQREVFDGNSDKRILKIFNRLDFDLNASLRPVRASDLMTTFHWANDAELRAQSFNTDPIPLEKHSAWFNSKMNDPSTILYIFEYKNIPIGQIRFDVGSEAAISYSVDRTFRGRSWGQCMLQNAIIAFQNEWKGPIKIVGYTKQGNVSSNAIFKKLGFVQFLAEEYPNSYRYELIKL